MEQADSTDGAAMVAEMDTWDKENVGGLELTFTPEQHIDSQREERIIEVNNGKHSVDDVPRGKEATAAVRLVATAGWGRPCAAAPDCSQRA